MLLRLVCLQVLKPGQPLMAAGFGQIDEMKSNDPAILW